MSVTDCWKNYILHVRESFSVTHTNQSKPGTHLAAAFPTRLQIRFLIWRQDNCVFNESIKGISLNMSHQHRLISIQWSTGRYRKWHLVHRIRRTKNSQRNMHKEISWSSGTRADRPKSLQILLKVIPGKKLSTLEISIATLIWYVVGTEGPEIFASIHSTPRSLWTIGPSKCLSSLVNTS